MNGQVTHLELDQRLDELRKELHEIMDRKITNARADMDRKTEEAKKSLKTSAQVFFSVAIGVCGLGITILGWFINDIGKRVDSFAVNFRDDLKELRVSVNVASENIANLTGRLENNK